MRMYFLAPLLACGLLAACSSAPPVTASPDLTFANLKPVELDVSSIEVRNDYVPPMQEPHVEHVFPVPPYAAVEKMVQSRLRASGNSTNVLRVIVEDASVVREELPRTRGFWGSFTQEPVERLKAKMQLRLELYSPRAPDVVIGHAEVAARRNKTLLEGMSMADRERAYFNLTEDLMNDLGEGLRKVVQSTFGGA